jgi:hypothetical protein
MILYVVFSFFFSYRVNCEMSDVVDVHGIPLPPARPKDAASSLLMQHEREDYLRRLRFPKVDQLTKGCPASVATVLERALKGKNELVVLRGAGLREIKLGKRIASILEHHPEGIGELRLSGAGLGDTQCEQLLTPLITWDVARPSSLRTLDLSSNQISLPPTFELVEKAIRFTVSLREVDLGENNLLGDDGACCVANVLKDTFCSLERLSLRRCGIGPKGGAAVCDACSSNDTLRVLNLTGNPFGDEAVGCPALGRLLGGAAGSSEGGVGVKTLMLGDIGLSSPEGLKHLAVGLSTNKSLTDLRLAGNRFGDLEVEQFAEALRVHDKLTLLNLSACRLGDSSKAHTHTRT